MEREVLIAKFKKDVEKRAWWLRVLLAVDQLFNVILWNGSQDETISSHVGRRISDGTATWFDKLLCKVLSKFENNHCKRSLGE